MRKGPEFIALMYGTGRGLFQKLAAGYRIPSDWTPANKGTSLLNHMLRGEIADAISRADFGETESRVLADMAGTDLWSAAAGITLAAVNADPRNHFGKHALRRFDK